MEASAAAELTETLEEYAIMHFRCNVMGEKQENGCLFAVFQSLQIQSMLDFIILDQEDNSIILKSGSSSKQRNGSSHNQAQRKYLLGLNLLVSYSSII